MLDGKRILLIITGGIAAFKALDLMRRLRERGVSVRCILTRGGAQFVTPLSVSALSGDKVYQDIFSLSDEAEMGHIQLSRENDLVLVAPATANILAKMAAGIADDLATTALLASDKPILVAPAMNLFMWNNPATQANLATLKARGVRTVGPNSGKLADGEEGPGRMAEAPEIIKAIEDFFAGVAAKAPKGLALKGLRALVTSGPTREPIDPVRYISNHSSGKQGHAIAAALARLGAEVTLVSGPVALADPAGVKTIHVETAQQMLAACQKALPADVAICAAAVADWQVVQPAANKLKKDKKATPPDIRLAPNPDILATLAALKKNRPRLVVGFAAETENVIPAAKAKRARKGCDWIVANDVSAEGAVFGSDSNQVHLLTSNKTESWPRLAKEQVADKLALRIAEALDKPKTDKSGKAKRR